MDRYPEVFDSAEQARIQGNNDEAVLLYAEAACLAEQSSAADPVALHHMWGVALTSLGRTEEARVHLREALAQTSSEKLTAAINRDYSRSYLFDGRLATAMHYVEVSLNSTPSSDLAECGATYSCKARIRLAQGKVDKALELFGTADVLLQRSENRHYELYNLLHFLHFLVEFRLDRGNDDTERSFVQVQTARLISLAERYGGPPHRERAALILSDAFTDVES